MADSLETLYCPACGKEMEKIYIPEHGINIDICLNGCGGIFFDNRELEKFDEPQEKIDAILNAINGKVFQKVDERNNRICPCCAHQMTKTGAANGTVQLDVCYTCGGKFLDNNELMKIRDHKTSNTDKEIDALLENVYREEMQQMFGDRLESKGSSRRQFFEDFINRFII